MTNTATIQGRNLVITIDGVEEPFIIAPLGGRRGQALTDAFLSITVRLSPATGMDAVLAEAVGEAVYERVQEELSLSEAESILLPAFYWQTVLGIEGVTAYFTGGEGMAGAKKALLLLTMSLGISPTQTAPSGVLERLIQLQEPTPRTAASTTTVDKLPANKRSRGQSPKPTNPAA